MLHLRHPRFVRAAGAAGGAGGAAAASPAAEPNTERAGADTASAVVGAAAAAVVVVAAAAGEQPRDTVSAAPVKVERTGSGTADLVAGRPLTDPAKWRKLRADSIRRVSAAAAPDSVPGPTEAEAVRASIAGLNQPGTERQHSVACGNTVLHT